MVFAAVLLGFAGVVYGMVSGDVATALGGITSALNAFTSGHDRTRDYSQELARMNRELAHIKQRVNTQASNEYQIHMIAGGRFLLEMPQQWYYQADRYYYYDIIRDAQRQFVTASAVARNMGDAYRTAHAELAIFSCCLLLGSPDAQTSLRQARNSLENALLNGAGHHIARAYIDVLKLCQQCSEVGWDVGIPVDPATKATDGILAVYAYPGRWVSCLGVSVLLHGSGFDQPSCRTFATLGVAHSWPRIGLSLDTPRTRQALPSTGPRLPARYVPAQENLVEQFQRWWQENVVEQFQRWWRDDPPPPMYLPARQLTTNPPQHWQFFNQGSFDPITLWSPTVSEVAMKVQLPVRRPGLSGGYPVITFLIPRQ